MILLSLLSVFALYGASEGQSTTPDPNAVDLSGVTSELDAVRAFIPQLQEIVDNAGPTAELAQKILDGINDVSSSTNAFDDLIGIILDSLSLFLTDGDGADVASSVALAVVQVITGLPAKNPSFELPSLLTSILIELIGRSLITAETGSGALTMLTGASRNDPQKNLDILNIIIDALTEDLTQDSLKGRFDTLKTQLQEFVSGTGNAGSILNTIKCIIPAVKMYTGPGKDGVSALELWLIAAMKPFLGNTDGTNAALQKLLKKALAP